VTRKALHDIAALGFDASRPFGREDEVRPVDHLVGTTVGWSGLPRNAAVYRIDSVDESDGETPHALTVMDVPVQAFWSVTVYDVDGYLEANDLGVNSYNDVSAEPNDGGSFAIHFGGCEYGRVNGVLISPGWNCAVRMYEPEPEILDGSWKFPCPEPVH